MADDWQTPSFRQNMVARINDAISKTCPIDPNKNGNAMESQIFSKARSKEEYLSLVAKIIVHVREMGQNKAKAQNAEVSSSNSNIMPDPINALQNLASQGTRNTQMMAMGAQNNQIPAGSVIGGNVTASNLLQTLTQQRPGPQMQNMQGIRGQMSVNVPMNTNMPQGNMGPTNMNNQMGNTIGNINPSMNIQMNQIPNQAGPLGNCLPGQLNQIQTGQIQMSNNLQGQPINTMSNVAQMPINTMNQSQMNIGMNHQQLSQMMGRLNPNPAINLMASGVSQANIANQAAMTNQLNVTPNMNAQPQLSQAGVNPTQQSGIGQSTGQINPAVGGVNQIMNIQNMPQKSQNIIVNNNGTIFQTNRTVNQNQFLRQSPSPTVSSPAGISQPHQNTQMIPSPALVPSSSPQMSNIMANNQRNVALRQSPNAPLNTPGQVAASSPFNPQEDQIYREKYKQLTKYIEPLRRMVAKVGNDDVEKITKMNKLLEILCNPHQRIPLETLLKCEIALEKMDFKSYSFGSSSTQYGSNNPLFEAVNAALQNPTGNHTLQRTFRPCLEALFGTDIRSLPSSVKQPRFSGDDHSASFNSEIPHVLQGEIARLDQKFKVSLDSSSQNNNKTIKLICCLDDKRLPCVPPVSVSIPEDYPMSSPICSLTEQEYSATPFLIAVQDALTARISKLPKCFSLSHLLDTWEMAVRQACSPAFVPPTRITTILGV